MPGNEAQHMSMEDDGMAPGGKRPPRMGLKDQVAPAKGC